MNNLCVYAWKGLQISPNGDVSMCCFQHGVEKIGDLEGGSKTIAEVRRSDKWNEIRQSMLDGEKHSACQKCWDVEEAGFVSGRQHINEKYPESLADIHSAELQDDVLHQIDLRQSNLCNMKCLSCNRHYSSLWAVENAAEWQWPKTNGVTEIANDDIYNYLHSNMDNIKEFYFAGGEPLLNEIHWDIIETLDRKGRHDVQLIYNTNLLKLSHRGKHIFEYWDRFNRWHAGVSIDAVGERAEYVRHGTVWSTIENNLKQLQSKYNVPKIWRTFGLDCTVSALNVGGLIEYFEFVRSTGINNYRWLNYVYSPAHLHVSILPQWYREKMVKEVEQYFENCDLDSRTVIGEDGMKFFRNQMLNNDLATAEDKQAFKDYILSRDKIRGTDIFKACPEFVELWDQIE